MFARFIPNNRMVRYPVISSKYTGTRLDCINIKTIGFTRRIFQEVNQQQKKLLESSVELHSKNRNDIKNLLCQIDTQIDNLRSEINKNNCDQERKDEEWIYRESSPILIGPKFKDVFQTYVYPLRLFPSKDIYWDQSRRYLMPPGWKWATSSEFKKIMGLSNMGKTNTYNIPLHQRSWLGAKREAFIFADTQNTGESLVLSPTTPTAEITPVLLRTSPHREEGRNLAGLIAINISYDNHKNKDLSNIIYTSLFMITCMGFIIGFIIILNS
jgi:hypothetical protein